MAKSFTILTSALSKRVVIMQAMIITAYKNYASLCRVVEALSRHALCFVHADAAGEITGEQIAQLNEMQNVRAIRRYRVNWGSVRHLHALLDLCRMALDDERVTHLHLISAQDFPTVSHARFEAFLTATRACTCRCCARRICRSSSTATGTTTRCT